MKMSVLRGMCVLTVIALGSALILFGNLDGWAQEKREVFFWVGYSREGKFVDIRAPEGWTKEEGRLSADSPLDGVVHAEESTIIVRKLGDGRICTCYHFWDCRLVCWCQP